MSFIIEKFLKKETSVNGTGKRFRCPSLWQVDIGGIFGRAGSKLWLVGPVNATSQSEPVNEASGRHRRSRSESHLIAGAITRALPGEIAMLPFTVGPIDVINLSADPLSTRKNAVKLVPTRSNREKPVAGRWKQRCLERKMVNT